MRVDASFSPGLHEATRSAAACSYLSVELGSAQRIALDGKPRKRDAADGFRVVDRSVQLSEAACATRDPSRTHELTLTPGC